MLRALAREWRDWCQVDCVLDPSALFGDPGVPDGRRDRSDDRTTTDEQRWRLLILEDCDELIRAEAKQPTGQALSRLLNLTDGLLGQGRDVLVAITTNEDLARLHPAVVRPGRCLAKIEVGPLRPEEAARGWAAGTASARPVPRSPSSTRSATGTRRRSRTSPPRPGCTSDRPSRRYGGARAAGARVDPRGTAGPERRGRPRWEGCS